MFAKKRSIAPVPEPPYEVDIIGIPDKDARVLMAILQNIGGAPGGRRGAADRIANALRTAGVVYQEDDVPMGGGLHF